MAREIKQNIAYLLHRAGEIVVRLDHARHNARESSSLTRASVTLASVQTP